MDPNTQNCIKQINSKTIDLENFSWINYLSSNLENIISGTIHLSIGSPYKRINIENFMTTKKRKEINKRIGKLAELLLIAKEKCGEENFNVRDSIEDCLNKTNFLITHSDDAKRLRAYYFISGFIPWKFFNS